MKTLPINFSYRISLLWAYYVAKGSLPCQKHSHVIVWLTSQKVSENFFKLLIAGKFIHKSNQDKRLPSQRMITLLQNEGNIL